MSRERGLLAWPSHRDPIPQKPGNGRMQSACGGAFPQVSPSRRAALKSG